MKSPKHYGTTTLLVPWVYFALLGDFVNKREKIKEAIKRQAGEEPYLEILHGLHTIQDSIMIYATRDRLCRVGFMGNILL